MMPDQGNTKQETPMPGNTRPANTCTLCRDPLPCRLPEGERATRCAKCQKFAYFSEHDDRSVKTSKMCEENRAIVEARIAEYAARAGSRLPLFTKPLGVA